MSKFVKGTKVTIASDAFSTEILKRYNGVTGKCDGAGASGTTTGVSVPSGGTVYVDNDKLTLVE